MVIIPGCVLCMGRFVLGVSGGRELMVCFWSKLWKDCSHRDLVGGRYGDYIGVGTDYAL